MRIHCVLAALAIAVVTAFGVFRAAAQDATTASSLVAGAAPTTMTLVERAEQVTNIDLDPPGPPAGVLIVWGPDPLYDAANVNDTGATTQGTCIALDPEADCLANETILFADGSTLEVQRIQLGAVVASTRTIVGDSGRYRGTTGTVTVEPSAELATWTKTFELWP